MPSAIAGVEHWLAKFYDRQYCVVTGNGSTALYLAYSQVQKEKPKILMPAIMCFMPTLAVKLANKIPVFADVLETDATIDPRSVEKILKRDKSIGAVVAAHLYGHPAKTEELIYLCRKYGAVLIDDSAQAMGGFHNKKDRLGSSGDCSVVSFGHTKIIDAGIGGAFLTNSRDMYLSARKKLATIGARTPSYQKLCADYSRLYYAIWDFCKTDSRYFNLFYSFHEMFRDIVLIRIQEQEAKKILTLLGDLESEIDHRKKIFDVYAENLRQTPGIKLFRSDGDFVPWRFSFRVSAKLRDPLLTKVRNEGFDISAWYPNVSKFFPAENRTEQKLRAADAIEREIVNLWVTKAYSVVRAKSLAKSIRKHLKTMQSQKPSRVA